MRPAVAVLLLVTAGGCRIDLDHASRECVPSDTVKACLAADSHDDFAWLQENIFTPNCGGKDCHGVADPGKDLGGRFSLAPGVAYASLLGDDGQGALSEVVPDRRLVVPGRSSASYMFFLLHGVRKIYGDPPYVDPPDDVGYMPRNSKTLCCQKIDAVGRWIEAGAPGP